MSSFVQITNDLMAKELSNKWNALVPLPQQSLNTQENVPEINKASDLINRLTPENSKKEIHQLKRLIHKMQEQLNTIKVTKEVIDPRMFNNPLPNQSTITYKYGARSYLTDCYVGFTWRNGHWFQVSNNFKFKPIKVANLNEAIKRSPDLSCLSSDATVASPFIAMDDLFYPVIINGTRVFVKEISDTDTYLYFPFTQNIVKSPSFPKFKCIKECELQKTVYISGLTIEYEDLEHINSLFKIE